MTRIVKASETSQLNAVTGYFPSAFAEGSGPAEQFSSEPSGLNPQESASCIEADQAHSLRCELEELRASIPELLEQAAAKGREEERALSFRNEELRLEKLSDSLSEIESQVSRALEHSEWLSTMLVRKLLGKMFADSEKQAELLEQAIQRQYQQIDRKLMRKVLISCDDFPEEENLATLQEKCRSVEVLRDPELAEGECRVELRLGYIDLSLPLLRNELEQFIDALDTQIGVAQ